MKKKEEVLRSRCHSDLKVGDDDDDESVTTASWTTLSSRVFFVGLRRSLSEGYLRLEPQSARFLSDSSIHRLLRPTADLEPLTCSPSIRTLKKQLTQEGGSLKHMLLLLNGTKVDSGGLQD